MHVGAKRKKRENIYEIEPVNAKIEIGELLNKKVFNAVREGSKFTIILRDVCFTKITQDHTRFYGDKTVFEVRCNKTYENI